MLNFEFQCPTKVIFGKDTIKELSRLIPENAKVLMTYGGGSIKKNGVYDQVKNALKNHTVIEFSGIEPNPKFETCMKAVEIAKNENIDFILAVGGGSVLDGSKFISAAIKYNGDAWDILTKSTPVVPPFENPMIKDAISLGAVITLPATGSEMNAGAVISKIEGDEKLAFGSNKVYPCFSIIDPETTYSLPVRQTINGIIDTFVHVMEQYATIDVNTPMQDYWQLGIIKTLIEEAPKVLANPNDYDARANNFWCATCGLNYWATLGTVGDWATHMIGHEITAFYGLDHAQTLAIIMPRVLEYQKETKATKLSKMAYEVFGYKGEEKDAADFAIKETEKFFNSIGQKTKLIDYGVDKKEAAAKVSERFKERGVILGENQKLTPEAVYEILNRC